MANELPDFEDELAIEAWLRQWSREDTIILATRAALRLLPLVAAQIERAPDLLRSELLPAVFRASASPWLLAQAISRREDATFVEDRVGATAAAAAAADAAADAAVEVTDGPSGTPTGESVVFASAFAARAAAEDDISDAAHALAAASNMGAALAAVATDANNLANENRAPGILSGAIWPDETGAPPEHLISAWDALADYLTSHPDEGWQVWIDWYEARLRGGPPDWERERAYVLDLEDFWDQGPAAANAEIARRLADLAADRPSGERLDVIPETGRIGIVPAEAEDPEALENAVQKVQDALDDFRASPSANMAGYALGAALRKLDRALARYRENPRRLHDDFADSARIIARAVADDPELDTPSVRDLAETCAQGVLDIRIASREVSDMEADRRRRRARAPSAESRSALTRLLQEAGEALEPDLAEEMAEDVAELEASDAPDDGLLPDGAAKDAELRSAHRVAWLYRFSRMSEGQIVVVAERAMRHVDDIERLVNLLKTFDDWWPLISLVLRGG